MSQSHRLHRSSGLSRDPMDNLAERSWEGMAHFAGTGPRDKTCGTCKHWGDGTGEKQKAQQRACSKFTRMTGMNTKHVPRWAEACKYYSG